MRSMVIRCVMAGQLLGLATACSGGTEPGPPSSEVEYVPGELIIQLAPGVSDAEAARLLSEQGLVLVRSVGDTPPFRLIRVPVGGEAFWAEELVRQGLAVLAVLNQVYRVGGARA